MSTQLDRWKVVRFCKEKNKRIYIITGLKLYLKADLDELEKGIYIDGRDQVSMFWRRLVCRAKDETMLFERNLESDTCPWCRIFLHCKKCTYGKRNGICRSSKSRYKRVREAGVISEKTMIGVDKLDVTNSRWLTTKVDELNSITSDWYRRVILKIECDSYQIFWAGRRK